MASTTYRGFSTVNRFKKFRLSDFELAKQDLFNHLNTRKGEKLMNPEFGTVIWGLLFEPLTDEIKSIITKDLATIVGYDPRLDVDNITLVEYEHGIQVMIELRYISTNQTSTMQLAFDKNSI